MQNGLKFELRNTELSHHCPFKAALQMLLFIVSADPNPKYTGKFCHCYMLDESICHFRGVGSILVNPVSKHCRP